MEDFNIQFSKPDFELIKSKLFNTKKDSRSDIDANNLNLFKPFNYFDMQIKNHFTFMNLVDTEFYNNIDKFERFYLNIAKSGVGLIITGGNDYKMLTKHINIKDKSIIEKLKNVINKIHYNGSKIFFQIKLNLGRGVESSFNKLSYSAYFNSFIKNANKLCFRLSDSKCNKIVDEINELCVFSNKAGYDGVMIDGSLNNILGEFSTREFNKRYFGYYANYDELSTNIIKTIISNNKNLKIIYSITIDSYLKEIFENEINNIKSLSKIGRKQSFDTMIEFLIKLVKLGVDGFIFKFGTYENEFLNVYNELEDEFLFFDFYKQIKEIFETIKLKNKFGENIIIVCDENINTTSKCEFYFTSNIFNILNVSKQILADNNYLKNLQNNQENMPCIKCSYCNQYARKYGKIKCEVNPNVYGDDLSKISILKNKQVAVIGSGISGMMCACYLADRGFFVDLYEKNEKLNENGRALEIFGMCKLTKKFNDYIENLLLKNAKKGQINIKTASKLENIEKNDYYHAVVVATGFKEKFLKITGSVLKTVISIYDFMSNKKFLNNNKFIIYAKSELSLKLAVYLLSNKKRVSIIIQDFSFMKNLSNDKYSYYFYLLSKNNADVYIDANIKVIEYDFIEVIANKFSNNKLLSYAMNFKSNVKLKTDKKIFSIDYDLFVYEPEIKENNKLYYDIVASGYKGELYMIGNALQICDNAECIKSAYYVAKNL